MLVANFYFHFALSLIQDSDSLAGLDFQFPFPFLGAPRATNEVGSVVSFAVQIQKYDISWLQCFQEECS